MITETAKTATLKANERGQIISNLAKAGITGQELVDKIDTLRTRKAIADDVKAWCSTLPKASRIKEVVRAG